MLKQMKQTICILLAVCFLISVTAATVSAHGPVMVKEKKTAIIILKDVKTTICKWPKEMGMGMKNMNMKDMGMKNMDMKDMGMKKMNMKDMGMKNMNMKDMGMKNMNMKDMSMKNMNMKDMGMKKMDTETDEGY
jgi:hypothetical protein